MLAPGDRLGQYQIVAPLGAGGMGEVYRARDERLGREVAIKVLPHVVQNDRTALARFEREAKAVAAISHRNIVSIHHFESEGQTAYIVMELLEGETLRSRILRQLTWKESAGIGTQIAEALAAAHDRGVIHRDLKPANVFVLRDGTVKVLDFGLARITEPVTGESSTEVRTSVGAVVGTHGYMSPEQLRGEAVDHRTDIFSLGCVLYEMLTGSSPFLRSSAAASAAAIIHEEPAGLSAATPPDLRKLIHRCLRKNREERFQSARDVAIELRDLNVSSTAPGQATFRLRTAAYALVALLILSLVLMQRSRPVAKETAATIASLAVLPFENASHSADTEFLADGVTEGLINSLARLPGTRVVARTTAFAYKGRPLDLKKLHRDLNVEAVLTGKITVRENTYVVQADLIDVETGDQLWGNRYHTTDLSRIERDIAADAAARLRGELTAAQQARLRTPGTTDDEAYLLYLRGRHEWYRRRTESLLKARDYFQQAVARDPAFADAYAGLADTYGLLGGAYRASDAGENLSKETALARGEAAAKRALSIDPDNAQAYAALGLIESNRFHFRSAERNLKRALELNPSDASARTWYFLVLQAVGRWDEALNQIRRVESVDSLWARNNVALALYLTGDVDAAIRQAQTVLVGDDAFSNAHWVIGISLEHKGDYAGAAESYRRAMPQLPGGQAWLARTDAKMGRRSEALRVARELEERWKQGRYPPTPIAFIYSALGDSDEAFRWLDRALESRDVVLRNAMHTVGLSEVRDDPRFADLQRRMMSLEPTDMSAAFR